MSNSSTTLPREQASRLRDVTDTWAFQQGLRALAAPLRFVAFWAAVALPFLYLPLLVGGLNGERAVVFTALLLLNAVALVLGHNYRK